MIFHYPDNRGIRPCLCSSLCGFDGELALGYTHTPTRAHTHTLFSAFFLPFRDFLKKDHFHLCVFPVFQLSTFGHSGLNEEKTCATKKPKPQHCQSTNSIHKNKEQDWEALEQNELLLHQTLSPQYLIQLIYFTPFWNHALKDECVTTCWHD